MCFSVLYGTFGRVQLSVLNISYSKMLIFLVFDESVTDGRADGRTDRRTDGPTDGQTDPLTELRGRI